MTPTLTRRAGLLAAALSLTLPLALAGAQRAAAAPILLTPTGGLMTVSSFDPLGQSFTAEDPFIVAGLYFDCLNCTHANTDPIVYGLYEGTGTGGALLATTSFNLATGFAGYHTVDFSSVTLTVGSVYSLMAEVDGTSGYWAVRQSDGLYAGGEGIANGWPGGEFDLALKVSPVPEPSPGILLVIAIIGLVGLDRSVRKQLDPARLR